MITFNCDYCGKAVQTTKVAHYKRNKRHFCSMQCYANYRRDVLPQDEQNAWKGGITNKESVEAWRLKNKQRINAIRRARRIRELNAPGSHTASEWRTKLAQRKHTCVMADGTCSKGPLTKDHVVPLVMGGSQNIENIEPACRRHNSQKGRRVAIMLKEQEDA